MDISAQKTADLLLINLNVKAGDELTLTTEARDPLGRQLFYRFSSPGGYLLTLNN